MKKIIITLLIIFTLCISSSGCTKQYKLSSFFYNNPNNILDMDIDAYNINNPTLPSRKTTDRKLINEFYKSIKDVRYVIQIDNKLKDDKSMEYESNLVHSGIRQKKTIYNITFTILTPEKRHYHGEISFLSNTNFEVYFSLYKITSGNFNMNKIANIYKQIK